jgi:serine/threonine-protein kinase
LTFQLVPYDPIDNLPASVPVAIQTQPGAGQPAEGEEVEVSGVWDGNTLDADQILTYPEHAARKRESSPSPIKPPEKTPNRRKGRKGRIAALVALVGVIVLAAAAVVWLTDGFGLWNRPGPVIKPASATVFSPGGAPDNPQKADLAIDGNPDTSWPTVTYKDPVPFPNFIEGEGLLLHLSEPAALSAVTIDVSSTGTEVQIRSSPTETPAKLADTTELTPNTPLQPGHNRIEVSDRTKTSNVLVWISKLGTTDGQSRTEISEITLQAAG